MKKFTEGPIRGKILSFGIDDIEVKNAGTAQESRIVSGYANKATIDRGRDLVLPSAFKSSRDGFMENPIMFYNHNWDDPIGKIIDIEIREDGLFVTGKISKGTERSDYVWSLINDDVLKSFSIGFMPKELEYDSHNDIMIIKDLELLEISVVTIPMNADARFSAEKSLEVITPLGKAVSYKSLVDTAKKQLEEAKDAAKEEAKKEVEEATKVNLTEVVHTVLDTASNGATSNTFTLNFVTPEEESKYECSICKSDKMEEAIEVYKASGQKSYTCLQCLRYPESIEDSIKEVKQFNGELDATIKDLHSRMESLGRTVTDLAEIIGKSVLDSLKK